MPRQQRSQLQHFFAIGGALLEPAITRRGRARLVRSQAAGIKGAIMSFTLRSHPRRTLVSGLVVILVLSVLSGCPGLGYEGRQTGNLVITVHSGLESQSIVQPDCHAHSRGSPPTQVEGFVSRMGHGAVRFGRRRTLMHYFNFSRPLFRMMFLLSH